MNRNSEVADLKRASRDNRKLRRELQKQAAMLKLLVEEVRRQITRSVALTKTDVLAAGKQEDYKGC